MTGYSRFRSAPCAATPLADDKPPSPPPGPPCLECTSLAPGVSGFQVTWAEGHVCEREGMSENEAVAPFANGDNGLPVERDRRGRFLPGNSGGPGNPQARNVSTWRAALAGSVSPEDVVEVTQRLVEAAKAGEPWAIRELLDRCLGKPHVQLEVQGEVEHARKLTVQELREGRRLAELMLRFPADADDVTIDPLRPPAPPGPTLD